MRVAVALTLVVLLSGCSGGAGNDDVPTAADDFDDLGVAATATKGVLLGVVVDEAIRPLKGAAVSLGLPSGAVDRTTDQDGRFAFGDLEPGTYLVQVSLLQYNSVQSSFEVVANEADPPVHRVQLTRLFAQDPYMEQIKFEGFIACAYAYGVSSTCVNDYTRLAGAVPGCQGGCLRDYNVSEQGGNHREFVTAIGPGWQTLVMEMVWDPSLSAPASKGTLGMTLSFFERTSTGHWYGSVDGPSPLRMQMDVGVEGPDQSEEPALIPPEGHPSLFMLFGAGDEDVAVNQGFQFFQTNFYYAVPPEGWSFVNGDPIPF
jgi:hypothetical protein